MNEKAMKHNTLQQTRDEFKLIALAALIATAAIWVYVSTNLLWTAAVYFGFLVFISLFYGMVDRYGRAEEAGEESS